MAYTKKTSETADLSPCAQAKLSDRKAISCGICRTTDFIRPDKIAQVRDLHQRKACSQVTFTRGKDQAQKWYSQEFRRAEETNLLADLYLSHYHNAKIVPCTTYKMVFTYRTADVPAATQFHRHTDPSATCNIRYLRAWPMSPLWKARATKPTAFPCPWCIRYISLDTDPKGRVRSHITGGCIWPCCQLQMSGGKDSVVAALEPEETAGVKDDLVNFFSQFSTQPDYIMSDAIKMLTQRMSYNAIHVSAAPAELEVIPFTPAWTAELTTWAKNAAASHPKVTLFQTVRPHELPAGPMSPSPTGNDPELGTPSPDLPPAPSKHQTPPAPEQ